MRSKSQVTLPLHNASVAAYKLLRVGKALLIGCECVLGSGCAIQHVADVSEADDQGAQQLNVALVAVGEALPDREALLVQRERLLALACRR
jgi:hypothetical protein